jgi:ribonuclease HI
LSARTVPDGAPDPGEVQVRARPSQPTQPASGRPGSATSAPARPTVTIYSDGACAGNGRGNARGGWAAILTLEGGGATRELSGGERDTTNQRMELRSAIEGLRALTRPCRVTVCSDSAYVVNGMTQRWYARWRANGWLSSKKEPVANRDLWEQLIEAVEERGHHVDFLKVQGHADRLGRGSTAHERFNQRCDELAVSAIPA